MDNKYVRTATECVLQTQPLGIPFRDVTQVKQIMCCEPAVMSLGGNETIIANTCLGNFPASKNWEIVETCFETEDPEGI